MSLCLTGPGWRAEIRPADHPVADFDFDVVVGADGRRNTLEGLYSWQYDVIINDFIFYHDSLETLRKSLKCSLHVLVV